jgi:hypothetical protein
LPHSLDRRTIFMMEERITILEAASDSNASALAALRNEMSDRFKLATLVAKAFLG